MQDNKHDECNVLALISHLHTSPTAETLGQSTLAYQTSWLGAFPCGLQWNSHREAQLIPVSDSARPRQPDLQPLSNPKSWKGEEKLCAIERFESWRHSYLEKDLLIQSLFVNLFRQGWKTHFLPLPILHSHFTGTLSPCRVVEESLCVTSYVSSDEKTEVEVGHSSPTGGPVKLQVIQTVLPRDI